MKIKQSTKIAVVFSIAIAASISSCNPVQQVQPIQQIDKARNVAAEVVVTVTFGDTPRQILVNCRDGKAQPNDAPTMTEEQLKEFEAKKPAIIKDACPNMPK